MRIKVDEDLPGAVAKLLSEAGHDAIGVIDQGMGGAPDAELWRAVQVEHRLLVTADKGFADIRSHMPGTHAGVLLLRPDTDGIGPLVALLRRVLQYYNLVDLSGTVTVATSRRIRIRRA